MDAASISSLASSLSAAVSITKSILGMNVDVKVKEAVAAIQQDLISAQSAAIENLAERETLIRRVYELEKALAEVEDWKEIKGKLAPKEFDTGAFAYVSGDDAYPGIYCPKCFENQKLARMQETRHQNGAHVSSCLQCGTDLKFRKGSEPKADRGRHWMA